MLTAGIRLLAYKHCVWGLMSTVQISKMCYVNVMIRIATAVPESGQQSDIFISAHAQFSTGCRSTCFTKFVISRIILTIQS